VDVFGFAHLKYFLIFKKILSISGSPPFKGGEPNPKLPLPKGRGKN
jgi:hypothetical protein